MQENSNLYASSRGILKSCDYYSQNPISSINILYNYPHLEYLKTIKKPSIYICSSVIKSFIKCMLPQIDYPFILVSGDCDETISNDMNNDYSNILLEDQRLIHWFCQNNTIVHNKITTIPIGLDYHTLTQIPAWGDISTCKEQELSLINIKSQSKPFWNREQKCYATFHFALRSNDRKDALNNIDSDLVHYEENQITRLNTWNNQKDYTFVISPHGNGVDCHRTWEALCLGCIPIVKTSPIDILYKDLPVLIVEKWEDINIELLERTSKVFKTKQINNEFNMHKLELKYWVELIKSYKDIN